MIQALPLSSSSEHAILKVDHSHSFDDRSNTLHKGFVGGIFVHVVISVRFRFEMHDEAVGCVALCGGLWSDLQAAVFHLGIAHMVTFLAAVLPATGRLDVWLLTLRVQALIREV